MIAGNKFLHFPKTHGRQQVNYIDKTVKHLVTRCDRIKALIHLLLKSSRHQCAVGLSLFLMLEMTLNLPTKRTD